MSCRNELHELCTNPSCECDCHRPIDPLAGLVNFFGLFFDWLGRLVTGQPVHWYIYKDHSGWIVADAPNDHAAAKAVWNPSHAEAVAMVHTLIKAGIK